LGDYSGEKIMKQYIFFMGLVVPGIIALEPLREMREVEDYFVDMTLMGDSVAKRIGIKALLENVIKKIEHLKTDHSALEKTFDSLQEELHAIRQKINDTFAKDNRVITTLQREVKILKYALVINFALIVGCQSYFYYDQY
jgi:hypothetical protein